MARSLIETKASGDISALFLSITDRARALITPGSPNILQDYAIAVADICKHLAASLAEYQPPVVQIGVDYGRTHSLGDR
jgi:hypothetical protein